MYIKIPTITFDGGMEMIDLLKTLTSLAGPCGYEHSVSYFLKEFLEDKVDEVRIDPIGNVIAKKKGDKPGPTVLLTAHIDEIGFIVKKIEPNGLLRFEKLGGNDDRILLAQPVRVMGTDGEVPGVIGTISAHYAKFDDATKVRKHSQMYIDIGTSSKNEVLEMGVEIGTPVTWGTEFQQFGPASSPKIRAKSLDDRAGCAVLLQTLKEIQEESFAGELIFLFVVQEEVGLRGAKTASEHLNADAAIAVDTTAASDTPEETMDQSLALGAGTGIKVMDFSLIVHKTMKETLIRLAKENKIPYQLEVFPGIGTDGGAVNYANKGIPTGVLSIPSRYAHSPVEVVDVGDLEATKDLVKAFLLNLHEDQTFPF
jgi:tetrahedral aminopeptidase